jgi:D-alanyl-lipoteichoic acid acyltransferase DltB (MBOAT superfamily)
VHNRWSEWIRPRLAGFEQRVGLNRMISFSGWLLTFHYVTLGWVWFALPDSNMALSVFRKLLAF